MASLYLHVLFTRMNMVFLSRGTEWERPVLDVFWLTLSVNWKPGPFISCHQKPSYLSGREFREKATAEYTDCGIRSRYNFFYVAFCLSEVWELYLDCWYILKCPYNAIVLIFVLLCHSVWLGCFGDLLASRYKHPYSHRSAWQLIWHLYSEPLDIISCFNAHVQSKVWAHFF